MRDNLAANRERQRPPQTWRRVSNLARQAKGSERDLHRSDNLLCEQRRNQPQLPSRVGRQDANAVGWGSEVVIVVGVTSHQGVRESRAQGEGPQNSMFQVNPKQAAVGRITKPISKELPDEQCCGRNGTPAQNPGKIEFGTPGARKRARPVWGGLGGNVRQQCRNAPPFHSIIAAARLSKSSPSTYVENSVMWSSWPLRPAGTRWPCNSLHINM